MKAICAWCKREGAPAYLGEREPLDDHAETHGICGRHLQRFLTALPSPSFPDAELLLVIRPSDNALYEHLQRATSGVADIHVLVDRRRGERRHRNEKTAHERRKRDRRLLRGEVFAMGYTLVRLRRRIGTPPAS